MTLRDLHQTLTEKHGIQVPYNWISSFVNEGDVAEQLRISGTRSGRTIDESIVPIIADFINEFRRVKGRLPQAPDILRAFLASRMVKDGEGQPFMLTQARAEKANAPALVDPAALSALPASVAALMAGVKEFVEVGKDLGVIRNQTQEVFTQQEAAAFLKMSVSTFRKHGPPPFRTQGGKRWRREDLLRSETSGG